MVQGYPESNRKDYMSAVSFGFRHFFGTFAKTQLWYNDLKVVFVRFCVSGTSAVLVVSSEIAFAKNTSCGDLFDNTHMAVVHKH